VRHHPPLLGQHNEEVLTELGYTGEQIAGLRERGVIGKLSDKRSGV
jgi:crotonobetainyl-CoA:carnitine CoA-transferase CaiB-like acyl-CoA transferase